MALPLLVFLALCAQYCAVVVTPAPSDDRVAVSREDFREKLRGRKFERWKDFKDELGSDSVLRPEPGGEERLMSGLSIAFVIILNVLVWAVACLIVRKSIDAPVVALWGVFALLVVYAFCVNAYCHHAYKQPRQRLVTNFLFGAVPLAVSSASYILALLVLHHVRSALPEENRKGILDRLDPWQESFLGRLIFFLAVLPGLATSMYLGSTVSTGFEAASTHFDVLSFCIFVDIGRFFGHASYLFAREWSIGASPSSISSRPGLCYVFETLCIIWFVVLARLEASRSFDLVERTKIQTLACLTTYVFFPLSVYLTVMNLEEFFDQYLEKQYNNMKVFLINMSVAAIAFVMLMVAVIFDIVQANLLGIAALLWVVFYGAWKLSGDNLLWFILALLPLSAAAFGAVLLSARHAPALREALLAAVVS